MKEQLPLYQCHKRVRAAKIVGIEPCDNELRTVLHLEVPGVPSYVMERVDAAWKERNPKTALGGYFVEYDDGYTSYSTAAAFESGYTVVT